MQYLKSRNQLFLNGFEGGISIKATCGGLRLKFLKLKLLCSNNIAIAREWWYRGSGGKEG